jgi:hypothetical protein
MAGAGTDRSTEMPLSLIVAVHAVLDCTLLGGLAWAMSRPSRLTPHRQRGLPLQRPRGAGGHQRSPAPRRQSTPYQMQTTISVPSGSTKLRIDPVKKWLANGTAINSFGVRSDAGRGRHHTR